MKTFKGGSIIFGLAPPVECIIRALSDTGAEIQISNPASVPETFQLLIKPELIKRNCWVVSRSGDRVRVQFV